MKKRLAFEWRRRGSTHIVWVVRRGRRRVAGILAPQPGSFAGKIGCFIWQFTPLSGPKAKLREVGEFPSDGKTAKKITETMIAGELRACRSDPDQLSLLRE